MQAKQPCGGPCGGLGVQATPSKGHGGPKGGSCVLSVVAAAASPRSALAKRKAPPSKMGVRGWKGRGQSEKRKGGGKEQRRGDVGGRQERQRGTGRPRREQGEE